VAKSVTKKRKKTTKPSIKKVLSTLQISEEAPSPATLPITKKDKQILVDIFKLIHKQTLIDPTQYKFTTVYRRIQRQMLIHNMDDLNEYYSFAKNRPEEIKSLCNNLFVHVTEFFRDKDCFDFFYKDILPKIVSEKNPGEVLRVWTPGCSTGEEVYSLAMLITEYGLRKGETIQFQIFGTDISEEAIQTARQGEYGKDELEGISKARLEKYFDRVKNIYKIKKSIRDNCVFSRHDMTSSPPLARMDLVTCRNVLIYFSPELQQSVLPVFHYALNPGGFLWLGKSETPIGISKFFTTVDKTSKFFRKVPGTTPVTFQFPVVRPSLDVIKTKRTNAVSLLIDKQKEVDRIIMSRYAPAAVVVNSDLEILQVRGHTSPYLELPNGTLTYNLFKLIRPDLLPSVRQVVQSAIKKNSAAKKEGLIYEVGEIRKSVDIEALPINGFGPEHERQYLVVFLDSVKEHSRKLSTKKLTGKKSGKAVSSAEESYIQELVREVESLRQYQEHLSEGYSTSQEELTAANEELQSTLEEFQSNNEELETAKEELQAANEELTTVNSELQERAEQLSASEERFRLLIDSVKDYAIFMLDPDGRVKTWNEGARRFIGYEASEIIGHHFSKFYDPADIRLKKPEIEIETARTEGRYEEEGIRLKKDGTKFFANIILTAIRDDAGNLRGFAKITRDITERKLAQEALKESEERYRMMIDVVKDYAIFRLDANGNIITWNEGAKNLKGYEPHEIIGKHFSVFYGPEDIKNGKPAWELNEAITHGRVEDHGWRIRKDGSKFWANVILTAIRDASGKVTGFTKVTRDMTKNHEAEIAINQSREILQKSKDDLEIRVNERTRDLKEAVKARDEFISVASHELKTPLTALRLNAQLTKRDLIKGDSRVLTKDHLVQFLDQLDKQVDRLHNLVEDMLDVSRIQRGSLSIKIAPTDLSQLCQEVFERYKPEITKAGCDLKLNIEPHIEGNWDRARLEQVIVNLVSNAAKYGARKPIDVKLFKQGDKAIFKIKDSGVGISPSDHARIFERFERAISASEISGLGLGLYITKEIITAHKGEITVESDTGKGAEFTVTLPIHPDIPEEKRGTKDYEF
jgi:PAS domain S-box-containing protein